jgi:hypothetical protein
MFFTVQFFQMFFFLVSKNKRKKWNCNVYWFLGNYWSNHHVNL